MVNIICTRFKDSDGIDLGCHLISKEYLLEIYPSLQEWVKAPALWMWGRNTNAQLGDNSIVNKSSPIQTIALGTNWREADSGTAHTVAIKTDGTLWSWGIQQYGSLGDNSSGITSKSSPVQTVSGGTSWRTASAGKDSTAAIKTDGTLWMWGLGFGGNLGNNSILDRSSPVQTVGDTINWQKVSVGRRSSSGGIKTNGTLWMWGYGGYGILGTNNINSRSSPVQTISGGTNWKQLSVGRDSTAAVKTDGSLWVWGLNTFGQLGNNGTVSSYQPIQTISNVNTWKQSSVGDTHMAAIKTNGSLWVWGRNTAGSLGNNSTINVSSPVQTVSVGTNWQKVSSNRYRSAAIKTDGSLWLWGYGAVGSLGNNATNNRSSPVQTISRGTDWRSVSLGCTHTAAIRNEGGC